MPGAFCMMSFRIVRQNLSWPRIFLCFFSRNLFLSSTSHMVNRFSRDGATLSSACSGSTTIFHYQDRGCHQPAFLHLSIEPPGSIQQKTSAAARAPPRARSQSCHYPCREAVGAGRWNLRFLWRSQQSGMEVWMKQRDSWEDTFFAYCEYWEDAFFKYCVHWCKNWEALPGRRA